MRHDLRDDRGNVLASVMVVSMLIGVLSALALNTGRQADTASTSDRNYDLALGVAEAGEQQAISKIQATLASGQYVNPFSFSGATPQGTYDVDVTRTSRGFQIDAEGTSGGDRLARTRHIRVTLAPPRLFPDGRTLALFSNTSIEIKNNDEITGDAWANDSFRIQQGATLHGDVTAAQSWVQLEGGARVDGDVWSGGYSDLAWAVDLGAGAVVGGDVKASVSAPSDPDTCQGEPQQSYTVATANGSSIGGSVTTLGSKTGSGAVSGLYSPGTCSAAATAQSPPLFTYNPNNYDPATRRDFTVAQFQDYLTANNGALSGTFNVQDPAPSQLNRIDLTGARLVGTTTIHTNAPVFTNGITDEAAPEGSTFVIVSRYAPPTSTACDVNLDSSECSVHVKNNFDSGCRTAVLIYADQGPVAVKNLQAMCGTLIGDGILIKNLQELNFSARADRIVGFGNSVYEIEEWQELPPA